MAPVEIIEQPTVEDLTAQSRRLQQNRKPRAFAIAVASNRAQKAVKLPSAITPLQVCPLRCRSRFTTSRFMAPHEAAAPSSARRSQAAGAVAA
ncbi:MAG: hypothetical protein WAW10_11220 [Gallionella sp.]